VVRENKRYISKSIMHAGKKNSLFDFGDCPFYGKTPWISVESRALCYLFSLFDAVPRLLLP